MTERIFSTVLGQLVLTKIGQVNFAFNKVGSIKVVLTRVGSINIVLTKVSLIKAA